MINIVEAADWISHVSTGGLLGFLFPNFCPWLIPVAIIIGFISHWILDILFIEFSPFPLRKYWWWVTLQGAFAICLLYSTAFTLTFWTIVGSLLPDIIDGIYSAFNPEAWRQGKLLIWFHRSNGEQQETIKLKSNIFMALALAIIYFLLRGKRNGKNN